LHWDSIGYEALILFNSRWKDIVFAVLEFIEG
jgi:hypothetical protein